MSSLNINSKAPVSYFTAPELDDGQYDEKVDVFAFSGILYQMVTGHIPFPKKDKSEVVKMLNEGMRPELTETDLSKELNELIELCWSQDPNQRISFDQVIFKMVEKKKKIVLRVSELSHFTKSAKSRATTHSAA